MGVEERFGLDFLLLPRLGKQKSGALNVLLSVLAFRIGVGLELILSPLASQYTNNM